MGYLRMGFRVLGARGGQEVSGPSGVVAEMDGREFEVSHRFVQLCHSGWCLILVPVCRCGGDLLGFGSCGSIELLEQAVRIIWASACRPGRAGWAVGGGRWGEIWAGGGGVCAVFGVGRPGVASWERGLHSFCIC